MDGALDRKFLKGGGVKKFPEQPDLTEQVQAALNVLSRNETGFFLMVESGLIDKYAHVLDMERAVYDTIMLDNAVRLTREWARARGDDTLILVLADHNHPEQPVGTINDDMSTTPNVPLRERVGVYEQGRISRIIRRPMPRAIRRASMSAAGSPSSRPACRITTRPSGPKLDNPNEPTVKGERRRDLQGQRQIQGRARRRAAARQSAGDDRRQRAFGRGRHPDRDRAGQRARARLDGQHRGVPRHGRCAWARCGAVGAVAYRATLCGTISHETGRRLKRPNEWGLAATERPMAKYRDDLPQRRGGIFLTDGGMETTLIFHEGCGAAAFRGIRVAREHGRPCPFEALLRGLSCDRASAWARLQCLTVRPGAPILIGVSSSATIWTRSRRSTCGQFFFSRNCAAHGRPPACPV